MILFIGDNSVQVKLVPGCGGAGAGESEPEPLSKH